MFLRPVASLCLLAFVYSASMAQSAAPRPAFEIADVHASPHRMFAIQDPGVLRGDRYVVREATMLNLIALAYSIDPVKVQGGPSWLEMDRFDIIAKAPPNTSPANLKLMMQSLLADRFNLVLHNGDQQMATYVLTAGKDKPKLKESSEKEDGDCSNEAMTTNADGISVVHVGCHHVTMEGFVNALHDIASGYLRNPVVDSTGLKGRYDFKMTWTPRGQLAKAGADGISLFDAIDKELGLKLTLQTTAQQALIVDSANEQPSPNATDMTTKMPPEPLPAFDVAVIKPNKSGALDNNFDLSGSQLRLQNVTLKTLVAFAWDLNANDSDAFVAPSWLGTERFDVLAKAPTDVHVSSDKDALSIDPEDIRVMLRDLLIERFQIKSHMEDRQVSAFVLTAANPKLHKADPASRTHCVEGPGPDGKDPRVATPALNRLLTCQNMTMAQLGEELRTLAGGYIYSDVLDKTGLAGGWDFTLSFTSAKQMQAAQSTADNGASDPSGALSLTDAVNKELGLKLEKERRPAQVLVIDSIQQKPTAN